MEQNNYPDEVARKWKEDRDLMLAALKLVVESDMAMREEDEGRKSPVMALVRSAIKQAEKSS